VTLPLQVARENSAMKIFAIAVLAAPGLFPGAVVAAEAPLGWPEVISLLAKAKTQAMTCVEVLKANGDKSAIGKAQLTYGMAKSEMDGVIAGLKTALVEGGDPGGLPNVRGSLGAAGQGLKAICDAATATVTPNTKSVWDEVVKAAVEPLIKAISDGVGALWTHHVEADALERETKKSELEAAKWPKFTDISAS
jgi:hypothetical protein